MATFGPTVASKDTTLREVVPLRNYGGATSIQLLSPAASQENHLLISWDVSSIPEGAVVSSATIGLYFDSWNNTNAVTSACTAYPMTRDYVGGVNTGSDSVVSSNWNTYNGVNAWSPGYDAGKGGDYDASFGSEFSISYAAPPTTQDVSAVTAVQKALDSYRFGGLIGILLRADAANAANQMVLVGAVDNATAGKRPTLTIEYTVPATGPGSGSLMLLGVGK